MPNGRRTWRRRTLIAGTALLATLLLAEGALRTAAWALQRERGMVFDPVLGWRMLPGIEKWGEFWSATEPGRTNEHGWRDRGRTIARAPGERRIAAIGDSFTFGQGVDAPQRFTELLEQNLGWQVLNFGCCAYGPDQGLLVFEHHASVFEPDAVLLVLFLGNDFDDLLLDRKAGWSKPWFRARGDELELVPPHADWQTHVRMHSFVAELVLQFVERNTPAARRAEDLLDTDPQMLLVAVLRRLHAAVLRRDAHLLVALAHGCDDALRLRRDDRADALLAALQATGVDTFDTHAALAAAGDVATYLPNGHWSPAGHAIVARALAAELARRPWFRR
jgi:lysophospholipase L1-like esterase